MRSEEVCAEYRAWDVRIDKLPRECALAEGEGDALVAIHSNGSAVGIDKCWLYLMLVRRWLWHA